MEKRKEPTTRHPDFTGSITVVVDPTVIYHGFYCLFHCGISLSNPKRGRNSCSINFLNWSPNRRENQSTAVSSMSIHEMVNHVEDHIGAIRIQEIGLNLQHGRNEENESVSDSASTYLSTD